MNNSFFLEFIYKIFYLQIWKLTHMGFIIIQFVLTLFHSFSIYLYLRKTPGLEDKFSQNSLQFHQTRYIYARAGPDRSHFS